MFEQLIAAVRPIQFKGKARLFNLLVPRTGTRPAVVHGYRVTLDLSEHIQRMVYLGTYERWETRTFRRYLRPGMSVVDVGANIGYFTLLAAQLVGPTGHVIAVEPCPAACDRLAITVRDNAIGRVRLERCGLGRTPGEVTLYDPLPDNHSPTMRGQPGAPGQLVAIRTLDELAETAGLDRIDLLKIDVEGYEPEVIAGAKRLIAAGRIGAVLCEFNEFWLNRGGTTSANLYADLLAGGFVDQSGRRNAPRENIENRFLVCAAVCK